ncbi:uncharacterized protein I206_107149 [Kwoniella pini CBS 10737]|uniref:DinB-like domain-containing protein n=1 Tax=Kwoniella pini CBS 10737 TaxID=1296096 RepID=A0A1B9HZ70_9TREE|nr:uncharacterized protein I206_05307 [Kwoniella pini CBS 10737]OCF48528.1 hypothetical protein I206_05307 [Kwoniella pini CBS 10737]
MPSNPYTSLNHTLVSMPTKDQEDRAEALLELSISLIDSCLEVLKLNITKDEQLIRESNLMPGGTLGKHFRHVIESFNSFLLPLKTSTFSSTTTTTTKEEKENFEINYDNINQKSRYLISRSIKNCILSLEEIKNDLINWGEISRNSSNNNSNNVINGEGIAGEIGIKRSNLGNIMEKKINVIAITPTKQVMGSTIGRELWYCSLHAIHHFSMLRTIAVHEHGIELPVEFGTAPSTLLYRGLNWKPPTENKEKSMAVKSKL